MGKIDYKQYTTFTGYNDTISPDNMHDTELKVCKNGIPSLGGGIEKRPGCAGFNETSFGNEVEWIKEWPFSDGSVKLVAVLKKTTGYELCLINENGAKISKCDVAIPSIGYVFYKDAMYFLDGQKYRVWGWFNYTTASGTQAVTIGTVVKNFPISTHSTLPGIEGRYYRSLTNLGASVVLGTAAFGNTALWEDITNGVLADHIIDVPAYSESDNNLIPIKRCTMMEFHSRSLRFFFSGDSKDPAAVYFSESDKPNYIPATNKVYPTSAAGPVTGLRAFSRALMVSYKRTWRFFSGTTVGIDAIWKPLPIPYGCEANDSICLTPGSLTFLSTEGICYISPSILSSEEDTSTIVTTEASFGILSDRKVEKTIKSIVNKSGCKAIYRGGKYYLSYCDTGPSDRNNKILVMDWDTKGFSQFTGISANYFCQRDNSDLLIASNNYILKYGDVYNDVDVSTGGNKPINFEVLSKPYNCGTPFLKFFEQLFLTAAQYITINDSPLQIALKADYRSQSYVTDLSESFVWGRSWDKIWGFGEIVNQWVPVNMKGFRAQIQFVDNTIDNPILIYGFFLKFSVISDISGDSISTPELVTDYNT